MSLSRGILDALLPPGSLWVPEDGADFDLLLNGIAANAEAVREYLETLAHLRDPLLTSILPDLETEFGIIPDDTLDEATRRARLLAVKTDGNSDGGLNFMQTQLQLAGFPVTVYNNSPAADPSLFTSFTPNSITGNEDALFGREGVLFGGKRGYLIVNGANYDGQYSAPVDPVYWSLVFFIGGEATRDASGVITEIATADVPASRRDELTRLIVKYKPMHSWCGLVVRYV